MFGRPVSDSTLRRALAAIDAPVAARFERARAAIRRMVWTLLSLHPGGFPWIWVCGREMTGWYVLDLDATIVTCTSRKEGAAGTFKGSFGHMPLVAWVANTRECVAMLLRPGNAPPNDVADHKHVLASHGYRSANSSSSNSTSSRSRTSIAGVPFGHAAHAMRTVLTGIR